MKLSPFAEPLVPANTQDDSALAARKRLQAVLDQLNPAGGKVDPGDGSGKHANKPKKAGKKKAAATNAKATSDNANAEDE